jgi:hypothetical protein
MRAAAARAQIGKAAPGLSGAREMGERAMSIVRRLVARIGSACGALILGGALLCGALPASAQVGCVREGAPAMTGNKMLVNDCTHTVTLIFRDGVSCRDSPAACTVRLAAGKSAIIATPAAGTVDWVACRGRTRPRMIAGRLGCD